ncbi:hypothetical protein JR316_0002911 [Psilocybe cubensis]|uniref:DUF6593 domain-containing protein n=2 Tax=Psilocybe cubensis TaxID=181762 RepID=A0A8H7Y3J4_PSICU|nr:hypothetical protein JR316_0002911 [Psilocybe cubensis]KAH9483443.1 hypothetical protein JR316_0002911 [Psilocybe cubensis]
MKEHFFRPTTIRYDGRELTVDEFFQRNASNMWGRNYVFAGHNGVEYVWKMEVDTVKLFVNDWRNTLVAHFHQRNLGLMHQARPAYLELFGNLDDRTVDQIIVTFVYVEKYRRECDNWDAI